MRSLFLLTVLAGLQLHAQQLNEALGLRLNVGFGATSHSGALHATSGIIDCGEITTGSGTGLSGSLGIEYPLSSSFGLGLELGLTQRGGIFTRENIYPLRDSLTGAEVNMLAAHTLSTTLSTIDLAPQIIIPIIGSFSQRTLGLQIGPRFALVQTASYKQEETVLSPDNAYFIENGKAYQNRIIDARNFAAATSMLIGLTASLESFITLNNEFVLAPRVSYDQMLTSGLSDVAWNISGIRAELGLRYSISPAKPAFIPPPPPPPPVIVQQEPVVLAPLRIALTAGPFTGEIVTGNALRASVPIVNAVFFDSASSEIPANYRRTRDGSVMSNDAVEAHDWIMIRIANIVAANPSARIVLEGATSGNSNEQDPTLARDRAEQVRRVLLDLGIASSAISIKSLPLPRIASNNELAGGREENRRVDIVVLNAPLQRWVQSEEFAEARGSLAVTSQFLGGDVSNRPAEITYSIFEQDTVTVSSQPAIAKAMVVPVQPSATFLNIPTRASSGGVASTQQVQVDVSKLPRRRIALRTDAFEAVLRFDYNSSELPEDVKILLQQLADQLPEGSTITIDGSADVLGSQERNRILSEARAATTQSYLRSITSKSFTFRSSSENKSFSNTTPQGRFLNRNIRIRVTTP